MKLDLGQWIVIGICALLIISYIRGYIYNRQRARQISTWLQEGLKLWGDVKSGEKLPGMATGGQLEIKQAAAPFRRIEVVYLLAPRENPLFWIFYRLQGKRDELLLWVTFQSKPQQTIEAARPGDRQYENRLKAEDKPALATLAGPRELSIACEDPEGELIGKVQAFLQLYQATILRLSLRTNKPHLFLRIDIKISQRSATDFFQAVSALAPTPRTRS